MCEGARDREQASFKDYIENKNTITNCSVPAVIFPRTYIAKAKKEITYGSLRKFLLKLST